MFVGNDSSDVREEFMNIVVDDNNGIVSFFFVFIKKLNVKMNGVDVYDCLEVN